MFGFIKKFFSKDDEYERARDELVSGMFERSENWQGKGVEIAIDCYENGLKDGALIRFTQILDLIKNNYPNNVGPIESGFLMQMNKYLDSGEIVNVSIEGESLNFIHKDHLKSLMES